MLREYEFTVITRGDLSEGDTADLIQKYEDILISEDGEILKKDLWGVRKMAFPIKKLYRGYYANYDFVTRPENLTEAERLMRIDENILRYLAVRIDDDVEDIAKRKAELVKIEEERNRRKDRPTREP